MKLTGETITDAQIEELREPSSEFGEGVTEADGSYLSAACVLNVCDEALGDFSYGDLDVSDDWIAQRTREARARCAELINARNEAKS